MTVLHDENPGAGHHFEASWSVEAPPEAVYAKLLDVAGLHRWWPGLEEAVLLSPGDEHAVGRAVELRFCGPLGVSVHATIRVEAVAPPDRIAIRTEGDLAGGGLWYIDTLDGVTRVQLHWVGDVHHRRLRWLMPMLRPVIERTQKRVLRRGEAALRAELGGNGRSEPPSTEPPSTEPDLRA